MRAATVALVMCLASTAAPGASAQSKPATMDAAAQRDAARQLKRLEDDWAQAVVHRDAAALSQFVAPRWVYSDESGVMDRDAGIKAFTSGTDTVRVASNHDVRAIVYPGTAVVIGILELRGRGPAGPFVHRFRYTDTWMQIDGRWQCIASQDYMMPDKRAR